MYLNILKQCIKKTGWLLKANVIYDIRNDILLLMFDLILEFFYYVYCLFKT